MREAFGDELQTRRGATSSRSGSLSGSQLYPPRRRGPTTRPDPRCPTPPRPNDRLPILATGTRLAQTPHLTGKLGRQRGEKLCKLLAGSAGAGGCSPPASEQPSAGAPRSPALRANLGAHRGHGRALTWHSLLSVQVVAVFTWVFKQVSGRENEGKKEKKKRKIQLCK